MAIVMAAQPAWTSRAVPTLETRGEIGTGTVAGIELGAVGVGVEWRLVPTLRLRTVGLLLGATGATAGGRSASGGAGGELAARLVPFPAWPVRPYMRMSAGLLLFLRQPFLPGGDVYDFVLGMGVGLEVPVGSRTSIVGDLHFTHLSNGQGLGPFNPAFNGYGGVLAINRAFDPEPACEAAPPDVSESPPPDRTPGAIAEGGAGHGGQLVIGTRVRVAARLGASTLAMLDAESQRIGDLLYEDVGLALIRHWSLATIGIQLTYEHLPGIDAIAEQAQAEGHITREASLVATGIWQQQTFAGEFATAGGGLRLFPVPSLRIDGGERITRALVAGARTSAAPYWSVEWQLPIGAPAWQVSLFVETQLSTVELGGVRVAWRMGATLRVLARRTGWARLR
jgi:hypothetical protein